MSRAGSRLLLPEHAPHQAAMSRGDPRGGLPHVAGGVPVSMTA